jgi:OsmC-like protein
LKPRHVVPRSDSDYIQSPLYFNRIPEMDRGQDKGGRPDSYWSVRVRSAGSQEAKAYAGKHTFTVGKQASFGDQDLNPTAVEYVLGSLGADLVNGFQRQASKRGLTLHSVECVINGRLDNPLVFLGVVGAEGSPGLGSISATLFVSADSEEQVLNDVWEETLARSPTLSTLRHGVDVSVAIRSTG